ncbi:MAG TPA: hypothetical protein DEQ02_10555 [Ruminococcaceae bacterium]|nr:hypothetical protein [Oscillospiraceae bacterium]
MKDDAFTHALANPGKPCIFCFPYLGGNGNSLAELAKNLTAFDVFTAKPPGHWGSKLPPSKNIVEITDIYLAEIKELCGKTYILFGHSMGGIIAYSVAHRIYMDGLFPLPDALVLSACGCPLEFQNKKYSAMPDRELIDIMMSYDAMPPQVLEDKELMKMLLPLFRADYGILESAAKEQWSKIPVKTLLIWGEKDVIEPVSALVRWQSFLSGEIKILPIKEASHMFISGHEAEIAAAISMFSA